MVRSQSGRWLGVDLGTYNSSAAIKTVSGRVETIRSTQSEGEESRFIDQSELHKEFPSFISFDQHGEILGIGMASKELAHKAPELVVWGV